jgi:hypothetical protein
MKTLMKRMIAGSTLAVLAGAFNGCAPVVVASRPRPVIVDPVPVYSAPPVQTVIVTPHVPVWAPPYAYVNQVHYYYFPDYMVYYDVFGSTYCYYNGFNWLHVAVLPSIPMYYGFNPYNSYIVVLNRSCYNPWTSHTYYTNLYPTGYYQTAYAPRTSLGSNTVLRAYDENQERALFVDKRLNKEVAVKYDVKHAPRTALNSNSTERLMDSNASDRNVNQVPRTALNSNSTERLMDSNASDRDMRQPAVNNSSAKNSARTSVTEKDSRTKTNQNVRNNATERNEMTTGQSERRSEIQSTMPDNRKDVRERTATKENPKPERKSTTATDKSTRTNSAVQNERNSSPARNTVAPDRKARNEAVKTERNSRAAYSETSPGNDAKSENMSQDKMSGKTR